jgi:hypothetical protein
MARDRLFASFLQGGFEGSCHRRWDGRQLDIIAATRHDTLVAEDYGLIAAAGLRTVRDALRWHLIEQVPGQYDWSSFLPMLRAARAAELQVIWDLCHYGAPEGLDIWSPDFVERFACFAAAAAAVVKEQDGGTPFYSPINEISFWAWAGGDQGRFGPYGTGRGPELKRQLVRASIAAIERIRAIDARARFIQPEPVIHIVSAPDRPEDIEPAARWDLSQYEACDMLSGRLEPALGGSEALLDIVGVNFYWNNQWRYGGASIPLGDPQHRPFHELLLDTWKRYKRPILVAETGAEGPSAAPWLGYVAGEVRAALRAGVPVVGICLYPVMDYPDWDDERHCSTGLIEVAQDWHRRRLRPIVCDRLAEEHAHCLKTLKESERPMLGTLAN